MRQLTRPQRRVLQDCANGIQPTPIMSTKTIGSLLRLRMVENYGLGMARRYEITEHGQKWLDETARRARLGSAPNRG
jgi:hypothetical protein